MNKMTKYTVGSVGTHDNICDNVNECPVCSGGWNNLSPMQQKFALAKMKHSPHLRQFPHPKSIPLTPTQLEEIKWKYQNARHITLRPRLIKVGKLDWEDFAQDKDFENIDKKVEQYYEKCHPQPMLIDVGEQGEKSEEANDAEVASILLSLGKNNKK